MHAQRSRYDREALVPKMQEVPDEFGDGCAPVRTHYRCLDTAHGSVQKHHRDTGVRHFAHLVRLRVRGTDDEAVYPSLHENLEVLALSLDVLVGVADDDAVAALPRQVFNYPCYIREERVLHVGHNEPERLGGHRP